MDEKPVYDTTDIPVLPLPFDPQKESNYQIALPSRYNDDGTNVVLSFPSDVPMQEAVTEIRNNFRRNSADTQFQMMLPPGDQFHLDVPASIPDFKQFMAEKQLYEEGYNTDLTDVAIDAAKDFVKGVYSVGREAAGMLSSADDKEMGRHAFNLVEAAMRGTENFSSLLGAGALFLKKKGLALVDSPEADQADYDQYVYMKGMAQQMAARGAGDMITEGGSQGMFGQLPGGEQLLSAVQKDPNVPAASPDDIKNINNAAMVLDPSWVIPIPGMQLLEKAGAKMAANTIARNFLPSVLATEVAPKMAFGALAKSGQALDYVTRGIFNTLSGVVQGVAEGSVTDASRAAANALARSTIYGGAFGTAVAGGGGPLIKAALAGKAARIIGEVGGAVVEGIESGSARMAVQELSQDMATSAAVRASARAALKIMPPDSAFNAMKGVAQAGLHGGMFMGTIGAMEADMAGDDPVKGFEEGFAGGVGFGTIAGIGMAPKFAERANVERVAQYFQDDSVGRSRERVFTATAADGTQVNVPINDMQGRIDLFNRTDIPLEQREMILAITRAHEKAGGEVFFHDGSEETRVGLQQAGLDAGKGFQIVDAADGRSIIVLDSNASDFSAATAAEEVFHGMFTDATAKEVWKGLGEQLGTQDATAITGELVDFANKYIAQLDASPGGKPHADKLREVLAAGTAPGLSDEQRVSTLTGIINEYTANYVGAAMAGMKPAKINQPQINNIWDKVWDKVSSNILSTFDRSRLGVGKDPITGHFFDSGGQRIKAPAMEHIVERFVDAAREGKASIDPQNTVDGATYFDVRARTPMQSVEDVVNGKQTSRGQKEKILGEWAADTVTAASSIDGSATYIVTPELRDSGHIHGNLPKDGKVVFFQRVMPEALVEHISNQVVNGKRVFDNPEIPKQWNDAVAAKRVITLDSWHNISKTTGNRKDSYYARANRWVLPLGTQQMPKGGLEGAYLDVSRLWTNTQELMKASPATKQSFKEKGVNKVEDFIPFVQAYFENMSSPSPVPTETLPNFTPEIRNAISKSLDLKQRGGELAEKDAARFKNDNGFDAKFFSNLPEAEVDIGGGRGMMRRESVTLASVRLDRINGVSEFTLNGNPVTIPYNVAVPNLVRANFSPGKTSIEKLGDSTVVTDSESGKRMIIGANGKTKLFDNGKVSIHDTPEQAEDRANKNSVAQARFSPKGGEFVPKVGDEVTVLIKGVEQKAKILQEHTSAGTGYGGSKYYRVDIPGSELISEMNVYPLKAAETAAAPSVETYKQFRDRIATEEKEALSQETKAGKEELLDAMADKQQWASDLEQRALAGERLPDDVLDSYRKEIGVDAYARTFRGQAEQKGYEPADVRARSNKEAKQLTEKKAELKKARKAAGPVVQTPLAQATPEQHISKIQSLASNSRSTTASLVDAIEKMYADGFVSGKAKNAFIAKVKAPEAQKMKSRKPSWQEALNNLYTAIGVPELEKKIETPALVAVENTVQPEAMLQDQPMPGAEERLAAATAKVEKAQQERVAAAIKKVQDKRMMESAKTPSSLSGGRMEEMYNLVQDTFSKKGGGIFAPVPKTPKSLESLSAFKEDIAKAFTPQIAERLTRGNPLVPRQEIAVQTETRSAAKRKRDEEQALAFVRKESEIRYKEEQRLNKLDAQLDALQARQRKAANKERAKEIESLLKQRDRTSAEADAAIQLEREASMANQLKAETIEAQARQRRTAERASVMEQLLQQRDAQNASINLTLGRQREVSELPRVERRPESQPESQATVPPGKIESALVPPGVNLFKTKSGKFKVILSSGEVIGITDEYKDAVKLAQKYATKTLRIRKGVR